MRALPIESGSPRARSKHVRGMLKTESSEDEGDHRRVSAVITFL